MIQKLLITNLRTLSHVEMSNLTQCNIFIGNNGSGKTSLLESIFLLSRGKSFRHHQPRHYVKHGQQETTVFAQFQHTGSIAVAKTLSGDSKLRLNTETATTQSQLTRELPVILLDPTQLDVLDHGSTERRALLDWLVFHIQPNFYRTWLNYQRALKQRNRILREHEHFSQLSSATQLQLEGWNEQLTNLGNDIHTMRLSIVEQWQPIFQRVCKQFLPQYHCVTMRYSAGFDTDIGLSEVLATRTEKDIELGYTRVGVHRADVMLYAEMNLLDDHNANSNKRLKKPAPDVFSRGEKKLLIMALKLSQLQLLTQLNKDAIVLLDDINAELDDDAVTRLLHGLYSCNNQLFITSLTSAILPLVKSLWQNISPYHINNGCIQPYNNESL